MSGHIIGQATVDSIRQWSRRDGGIDPTDCLTEAPERVLHLRDVAMFERLIRLRNRLENTSFSPSNPVKWGVVLMGGCRALSHDDWRILLG